MVVWFCQIVLCKSLRFLRTKRGPLPGDEVEGAARDAKQWIMEDIQDLEHWLCDYRLTPSNWGVSLVRWSKVWTVGC